MKANIAGSKRFNAKDGQAGKEHVYINNDEFLIHTKKTIPTKNGAIATALISFDQRGHVLNQDQWFSRLTGKRSAIESIVLIQASNPAQKPYWLGEWDQGVPGDVSFSPALCTPWDSHRYDKDWRSGSPIGDVGCREWTAQLYRKEPYIDITTYSRRGAYIGEVVGWSRFGDGPTPIIGKQGKQWLCLHECPAGEAPGVIPDIRAWTRKHGFPMPVRPPRQPEYPNANYKDDFNEFKD